MPVLQRWAVSAIFFTQISESRADVPLYLFIYLLYQRNHSNNKEKFKRKKNQHLLLTPQLFSFRSCPYELLFFYSILRKAVLIIDVQFLFPWATSILDLMVERPDCSSMFPNSIVTYIASSLPLFRWLFSLEYLDTFIILFLLAISPNNMVRKTTIHAAIMGSIGTDEALSVGSIKHRKRES